jgi:hypothetical protein
MNITVIADTHVFEEALKAARATGYGTDTTGLHAAGDATLLGRFEAAWAAIDAALREAYRFGHEMARDALELAIAEAEQLVSEAGDRARDLRELLLQRLQVFVHKFVTGALALVPTEVNVGDKIYTIEKLSYTQKVLVTGSIKVSVMEVSSLTSEGEMAVSVDYTTAS